MEEKPEIVKKEKIKLTVADSESTAQQTGKDLPAQVKRPPEDTKEVPSEKPNRFQSHLELLARRIAALLIDQVIVSGAMLLLLFAPTIVYIYICLEAPMALAKEVDLWIIPIYLSALIISLIFATFTYCAKFESSPWQGTPGKVLMSLRVTSDRGEPITYKGVISRIFIQSAIGYALTFVSGILCSLTMLATGTGGFLVYMVPLISCYLMSLFTSRGQTLFDFCTHRVVKIDNSSKVPKNKFLQIAFGTTKGGRDWFLSLTALLSLLSIAPMIVVLIMAASALHEADQIPWTKSKNLQNDSHYLKASSSFRDLGLLYYGLNTLRAGLGLPVSEAELERAVLASPHNWKYKMAYARALEKNGKLELAAAALKSSLSLRIASEAKKQSNVSVTFTNAAISAEEDDISIDEHYFRLGSIYRKLGQYKEALIYLGRALALEPTAQTYNERALVYEKLGKQEAAKSDRKEANSLVKLDTQVGTFRMKRNSD